MKKIMKLKKIKRQFLIRAGLWLALLVIIIGVFFVLKQPKEINEASLTKETAQSCLMRKIDGVCIENKESQDLWPVALMIDNNPEAWPQNGLSQAQVVYNTLVEGGTTRIMAVFASTEKIKKIGPIRSSRPYYLNWVKELDALYGHSGGSPEALEKIIKEEILNLEEITSYGPKYFYRDKNKLAPHNLFTDSEKINRARQDWELNNKATTYVARKFNQNNSFAIGQEIKKISIDYAAGQLFDVGYQYQTSTEDFIRYQNNDLQIDANDKEAIKIKNIIVQIVPEEKHLDELDRLSIETIGTGTAMFLSQGKLIKGTWQKKFISEPTKFFDSSQQEIIFTPGNIWIEIVPGEREIKIE